MSSTSVSTVTNRKIAMKKKQNTHKTQPLRRFDCFFADKETRSDPEDAFLDTIAKKINLLTLQISRIENRLSDYETKSTRDFASQYRLQDPPTKRRR